MAGPMDMTMPQLTEEENYEVRKYIALSHCDGKCIIYGDDGELQCSNIVRHGRGIDFRREKISDILDIIYMTRMREFNKSEEKKVKGYKCSNCNKKIDSVDVIMNVNGHTCSEGWKSWHYSGFTHNRCGPIEEVKLG